MTDLIFGVGVPTSAAPGDDPVGMALEAERLGFDFVSAADHPIGSSPSYETTTMLTWIAAHTSQINVASRVLGVPFRRPAMVAKFAASLDLLSGGRFILGLGAGYSDQEIAGVVGGPAMSPAEKIEGLSEAIKVVLGAWTRSGYSQRGNHHSVSDLTMEPRPAHPIPVWLGTFGPRAAEQVVSQLRRLLAIGFTGFNFLVSGPDQRGTMRRTAEEVLPAVRSTG